MKEHILVDITKTRFTVTELDATLCENKILRLADVQSTSAYYEHGEITDDNLIIKMTDGEMFYTRLPDSSKSEYEHYWNVRDLFLEYLRIQ